MQIASDGYSCSAQTPDIAWEKFQKKGCPRMKIWHGKRFSCKIDGVEVDIGGRLLCTVETCFMTVSFVFSLLD